jgi:hypothetical protein
MLANQHDRLTPGTGALGCVTPQSSNGKLSFRPLSDAEYAGFLEPILYKLTVYGQWRLEIGANRSRQCEGREELPCCPFI